MANPFYQQKDFRTEKLAALKGLMSDRRANRVVNRYMKSEAGQQEELKFAQDESKKYLASVDAFIEAGRKRREGMHQAALQNINTSLANRQPADAAVEQNPTSNANSNPVLVARKQPQRKPASQKAPASAPAPAPAAVTEPAPAQPVQETPVQPVQEAPVTPQFDLPSFAQSAGLTESREFDGRTYYRYDPDGLGDYWVSSNGAIYNAAVGGGLGRLRSGVIDGNSMAGYKQLVTAINAAKAGQPVSRLGRMANGGALNRINYFQQGGAAPKQSAKAQVIALVQAAMQGDEKAQQRVAQIMEAAKAGDQQMIPLAQMITAVAEQLQGQATAAKWGAKLNYIQSLKFAKGGETCPACEKKVEMKACGGKKAKKRYFGGII